MIRLVYELVDIGQKKERKKEKDILLYLDILSYYYPFLIVMIQVLKKRYQERIKCISVNIAFQDRERG